MNQPIVIFFLVGLHFKILLVKKMSQRYTDQTIDLVSIYGERIGVSKKTDIGCHKKMRVGEKNIRLTDNLNILFFNADLFFRLA